MTVWYEAAKAAAQEEAKAAAAAKAAVREQEVEQERLREAEAAEEAERERQEGAARELAEEAKAVEVAEARRIEEGAVASKAAKGTKAAREAEAAKVAAAERARAAAEEADAAALKRAAVAEETEPLDEPPVPAKSWSQQHLDEVESVATVEPKPKAVLKAAGGALVGLGVLVGGGGGIFLYTEANAANLVWAAKQEAADAAAAGGLPQAKLQIVADNYWEEEFAPRANLMVAAFIGGGVAAASGVVLCLIDGEGAPFIAPAPGGATLGWSGSF